MFKFIKQYAETISGVNIYPMISLLIFLIFFVVLLVMVKKMKKEKVNELSNLPFDNEELPVQQFKNTTQL
ncbi:MAG: CcoQ/FixQ family Cbb3-type cytochrome c oxidase assembly chaperone [Ferruginibacter sp.]|nr:CcoQ/FixQ family Cbb3-type cytochrome c oxidase assembly chaperone [Bacteroidota bacterium]MBX2919377.1 CcoQ/FixQ family Cbb3-type cytochrome c oxidase assembly chaperone [Ferruginibacter sp.]MCB0709522.1 CcoQ/FixQ family Cbb3-type cytochrome c oxidase assembly chaperone [Chitinophagaceae bacterium]MCC7378721.1 CcoQ/FixQ family Cbb3-type cytochrome c oxidase assembly chaperone [Chitinophagaceae bacterium]